MNISQLRISGLVLDWRGAAIHGVEVLAQAGEESQSATSDVNGHFELAPLPAGEVTVFVDWESEETTKASLTLEAGEAFLLIEPGSWEPVSEKQGHVEGVVRDGPGSVGNAEVRLQNLDSGDCLKTHTNNYGRFELQPVAAGSYRITVLRDGARLAQGRLRLGWLAREYLAIEVGQDISPETGFLSGRVFDENDDGIAGASLTATPVLGGEPVVIITQDSGYFERPEGISQGMYHLVVACNGDTLLEERMMLHPYMHLDVSTAHGVQEGGAEAAVAPEPDFHTVTVFFGTDRARGDADRPAEFFGNGRGDLSLGKCEVSIPLDHELGELEAPSFWRLEFREDPGKHVTLLSVEPQAQPDFEKELRERISASAARAAFVFIHGYNVSFEDAARRTGQMAYDLQFDGAPVFYSWPSRGTLKGYMADETASQYTIPHLREFLSLMADRSGAQTVHLIAHSMGNRALTAALRELGTEDPGRLFRQIALVAPDIDADIFKRDIVPRIVNSGERITLYASASDEALEASRKIHAAPRAGDTSEGVVVVEGMDTIDVTGLDSSFLGHSYFAENRSVISDLIRLLHQGSPPAEREWLEAVPVEHGVYWRFSLK